MPSYTLEIDAFGAFMTDMPSLEIFADGILDSTHGISATGTSITLTINFSGSLPTSLSFRFNDALAEVGRTIEIQSVRINDRHVNTGNFLDTNSLTQGASATVDVSSSSFLFESSEPVAADFLPATQTFTSGNDRFRNFNSTIDESFDLLEGRDVAFLGSGHDSVNGNAGNDLIRGGGGNDLLFGDTGNDRLFGQIGDDQVFGGDGNDLVFGNEGDDELHGGIGNDQISGHAGTDILTGGAGNDILFGGDGVDYLFGDADDDRLISGAGNDTLDGGTGDDVLYGGTGSDILDGSDGNDTLDGGADADTLFALDNTVNKNSIGATIIAAVTSPVTLLDVNFDVGTDGFAYADGSDPENVVVSGNFIVTDGNMANGALEVDINATGGAFGTAFGSWSQTINFTEDLSDVTLSFAYRHSHAAENDTNENSVVFYDVDGGVINQFVSTALGSGGATDTGWQTFTVNIGDFNNGDSFNLLLGGAHFGANDILENAFIRFDDVSVIGTSTITPEALEAGYDTLDSDSGSINVLNGGEGTDVLTGSSGNDTLNGGGGDDQIFAGTVDTQTALISSILATDTNVSYSFDTGNFYQVVSATLDWDVANTAAQAAMLNGVAGHLGTITSASEQSFIEDLAGGVNTWLGGTDTGTEGVWTWSAGGFENGAQFSDATGNSVNGWYTNWDAAQPNDADGTQDYLYLLNGVQWADLTIVGDGSTGFVTVDQYVIEWEGADIFESLNNNILNGGEGADTLYGSDGIDIFLFDNINDMDVIENFNFLGRDKIDISNIISYDSLADDINDFIQLAEAGGNTTISVDVDGVAGGVNFTDIAQLNGVTGLDLNALVTGDNLLV